MRTMKFLCAGAATVLALSSGEVYSQSQCSSSQISGLVYRDYDADGTKDELEQGEPGIEIESVSPDGSIFGTTTTTASGTFCLTSSNTPLRIQLKKIPEYLQPGPLGTNSVSTVTFLSANEKGPINVAISNPRQTCDNQGLIVTSCFQNGDPLSPPTPPASQNSSGLIETAVAFPDNQNGGNPIDIALANQTGAIYGIAVDRYNKRVYASAFLKRHSGLGSLGLSGIYKIDLSNPASPQVSPFLNLSSLGISVGNAPTARGLPTDPTLPSIDDASFNLVGKIGVGDIEISDDSKTLYLMNLFDRSLYTINIPNLAQSPTSSDVTKYPIPSLGCSDGDYRPFGIHLHDGKIFITVTCTAETSKNYSDLKGIIAEFKNGTFEKFVEFNLGFPKGELVVPTGFVPYVYPDNFTNFRPWVRDFNDFMTPRSMASPGEFVGDVQPLFTDITFNSKNDIIVAIRNRTADQFGRFNFLPTNDSNAQRIVYAVGSGDLLMLCKDGNSYVLESNASCPGRTPTLGKDNGQGRNGGEYYYDDTAKFLDNLADPTIDAHQGTPLGGVVAILERGEVVATVLNPLDRIDSSGIRSFADVPITRNGQQYSVAQRIYSFEVYPSGKPGSFGKAAGLGDMERYCSAPPIEIGNRVWLDSDDDGIQDANEPGIGGVTLRLLDKNSKEIAKTVTSTDGSYKFTQAQGLAPYDTWKIVADKPSDFDTGGPLYGLVLTSESSGQDRSIDSNARLTDGIPSLSFTTDGPGHNNHTYDLGFFKPKCSMVDRKNFLIKVDSTGVSLRNLANYFNRTTGKKGSTCTLSEKERKDLNSLAQAQEKDYRELWTTVWSIAPETLSCTQEIQGCVKVNLINQITKITEMLNRMGERLNKKMLKQKCLNIKGTDSAKYLKNVRKKVNQMLIEAKTALTSAGDTSMSCTFKGSSTITN